MSSNLSLITAEENAELTALLGGPVASAPQIGDDDLSIAVLTGRVRGEILAAAKEDGVGVRELARRLHVSPAAVSRHLRSDGDLRLSTAALFAHALRREWLFELKRMNVRHGDNALSSASTHAETTVQTVDTGVEKKTATASSSAAGSGIAAIVVLDPRSLRSDR